MIYYYDPIGNILTKTDNTYTYIIEGTEAARELIIPITNEFHNIFINDIHQLHPESLWYCAHLPTRRSAQYRGDPILYATLQHHSIILTHQHIIIKECKPHAMDFVIAEKSPKILQYHNYTNIHTHILDYKNDLSL